MDLRPFEASDFAELMTWFPTEASLIQWGGPNLHHPLDTRQLAVMLDEGRHSPPSRTLWIATDGAAILGHAQVALDHRHGVARLGRVAIAPAFRGRGLAEPFLARIVETAWTDATFERLELVVYTFNTAAIRTYLRLGFVLEGVRRSSVKVGAERWDTALYAMLRQDRRITEICDRAGTNSRGGH